MNAALAEAIALVEAGLVCDYGFNHEAPLPVRARVAELRKLVAP